MTTPELLAYIQSCRATGMAESDIKQSLLSQGWPPADVEEGLGGNPQAVSGLVSEPKMAFLQRLHLTPTQAWFYGRIGLVALAMIVLTYVGVKSYAYFTNNPEKIWADTSVKMTQITGAHFNFDASYSEQTPTNPADTGELGGLLGTSGAIKFAINGQGSMLFHHAQNDADYDMNSTLSTQLGSLGITLNFLSKKIGNIVYYKLDGNPLMALFGGSSATNPPAQWAKTDLNDNSTASGLNSISQIQKGQVIEAFKKAKLMKPAKLLGSEMIDGVQTWHYAAELDKQELKNYLNTVGSTINLQNFSSADLSSLVDKIEFKQLELWIGKSDHLIHQTIIESNAPGLISGSLNSARAKSRDAKRIADVHQLMTGLELFYNDNGRYPLAVNGQPSTTDGGKKKFSTYLAIYPQAPTPADGSCTETNNNYFYQQVDGGKNYQLTFCLGTDTGGYKAGILAASGQGIALVTPGISTFSKSDLAAIQFTGTFRLKLNLSQFNTSVAIDPPQGTIIDPQAKARDARRIADVSMLRVALELYYNDNNQYPASLSQIVPKDIQSLPTAPTPGDGACTLDQNKYQYQRVGQAYSITFCLGGPVSSYAAGPHTLTQDGIK